MRLGIVEVFVGTVRWALNLNSFHASSDLSSADILCKQLGPRAE